MTLAAQLRPAPAKKTFTFQICPPANQGAVHISCAAPLQLSVPGPLSLQLVLAKPDGSDAHLGVTVSDPQAPAVLRVIPTLRGPHAPEAAQGLRAALRVAGPLDLQGPTQLPLFVPLDVTLQVPPSSPISFFQDTIIEAEMVVSPAPACAAVVASRQPVTITVEAPFKRLLFSVTVAVGIILTLFLVSRLYVRLTHVSHQP